MSPPFGVSLGPEGQEISGGDNPRLAMGVGFFCLEGGRLARSGVPKQDEGGLFSVPAERLGSPGAAVRVYPRHGAVKLYSHLLVN